MRREQKFLKERGLPEDYFKSNGGFLTLEKILNEGQKLPAATGCLTTEQTLQIAPFLTSLEAEVLRRYCFSEFKNSILATDPNALKVFSRILFHVVGDRNAAEDYERYAERLKTKWQRWWVDER